MKKIYHNRCQSLKITKVTKEIETLYGDFQEDYQKLTKTILQWSQIPHAIEDNKGDISYVEQKEIFNQLVKTIPVDLLQEVVIVGEAVAQKSATEISSLYGLLYRDYNSRSAKLTKKIDNFFNSLATTLDSEDKIKKELAKPNNDNLRRLPISGWVNVRNHVLTGKPIRDVWNTVSNKLSSEYPNIIHKLKSLGLKFNRQSDCGYCKTVAECVRRQVASCCRKNLEHQDVTNKLKDQIEKRKSKLGNNYVIFCEFAKQVGCKFSKFVLFQAIKSTLNKTITANLSNECKIHVKSISQVLCDTKFKSLLSLPDKDIAKLFNLFQDEDRLNGRIRYPRCPNLSEYKMVFGLTGLMKFKLYIDDKKQLIVQFGNLPAVSCIRSHYFHDLEVKKSGNSYLVSFNHKLKCKKSNVVGNRITATVNQIGLRKYKGNYYVSLFYKLESNQVNSKIGTFFRSSSPDNVDELPNEFKAAAFDLNVSDPLAGVKALVGKKLDGPITAIDYGKAKIIGDPIIVCKDTTVTAKAREIISDIHKTKQVISAYKSGVEIDEPLLEFISEGVIDQKASIRNKIQHKIGYLHKKIKEIDNKARKDGYQHVSELIQIMNMRDQFANLTRSYDRIHLKSGESLPQKISFNKKRQNRRLLAARRLAAAACKYAEDCNVVFVEDLDSKTDEDNSSNKNSLIRLFSPRMLIDCLNNAFSKIGISVVEVDKKGTSKTDPVTGRVAYRDSVKDKKKAFLVRDDQLYYVDSDEMATVNILLQGLGHSIVPYKFLVKDYEVKDDFPVGKRLTRFFIESFSTTRPVFIQDKNGTVTVKRKPDGIDNRLLNVYLYYHGDRFLTENQHRAEEAIIKDRLVNKDKINKTDITSNDIKSYNNFSLSKMLDSTQLIAA